MATLVETLPVGTLAEHRMARNGMPRYTARPPIRDPSFEMMKPVGEVHEVVIAIEEDHTDGWARTEEYSEAIGKLNRCIELFDAKRASRSMGARKWTRQPRSTAEIPT
ncbi:MAG: hypothetical protein Q9186_002657 [Xanthomendoza sp. 1 TL-2023]